MKAIKTLIAAALIAGSTTAAANWQYSESTNPMTDETIHIAYGYEGGQQITFRCANKKLNAWIDPDEYIGMSSWDRKTRTKSATFRIDKNKAVTQTTWTMGTDSDVIFSPDPRGLGKSIIAGGERIAFATYDYNRTPINWSLPLTGAAEPIAKVIEACPKTFFGK